MWHATEIAEAVENLIDSLSGDRDPGGRPLYAGFDLGRDSKLSKHLMGLVDDAASMRALEARIAFVKEDLGPEPQVSARVEPFPHYVLHGRKVDYLMRRWPSGGTGSWEAALCTGPDGHATVPPSQTFRFHKRRIEVCTSGWIAESLRSVRSQGDPWDEALPIEADRQALSEGQARVVGFLQITNQLEALLALTQFWPVVVVTSQRTEERSTVEVTPAEDAERDELARLLGTLSPAVQMRQIFQADDVVGRRSAEQQFAFGGDGRLARRDQNPTAPWTFVGYRHHPNGPRYRFAQAEATDAPPVGAVFLRPRDLTGSSVLLHRRKKAIDDLRAHRSLLDAIDDPGSVKWSTADVPRDSEAVADLDPSKRAALGEIWRSQPFYMLQGPPGTGKTTLVATMVSEQVATSESTQLLVTAQSHTIVDNVADEVVSACARAGAPLAIRLDADKEGVRRKDLGRRATAARLATTLASSAFARVAPDHVKARLNTLRHDRGPLGAAERSGFERLVENGAAVVFATSNSGELAGLLDAGRRYDWSIVEEAGRAHGFDLVLPLQASHRTLMIGDQQQLPPYNVGVLDDLLADPARVLRALAFGGRFAPTLVERPALRAAEADPGRFSDDCGAWRRSLRFFRALYERCERVGEEDGDRIARQLVHQHRMHPHIRAVVSECFYPDLQEADVAAARFEAEADPFAIAEDSWMPHERIVFVDVPWLQRGRHARGEETRPYYTSSVEVDVVVRALDQLRAVGLGPDSRAPKPPSIQVLSPYRAQVNAIRRAVRQARSEGRLSHLDAFNVRSVEGDALGATVDEFQGNQADVVVVSLVRNNHHKRGKGLGILAEGPRWNVLLSRAKRKLVLVGSWDFLWSRFPEGAALPAGDPMADLARVMITLRSAVEKGTAKRVAFAELPRPEALRLQHPIRVSRRRRR